ncbi:MAG: hypothetical protein HYT63_02505 [Candidatus Yanofskybacteria bacterium]|nr:hypothetical protein [Candidatus Yanofskybacteria bacterium]
MRKDLQELINQAKKIKMTEEELEEQRISWAYGNLKLARPNVTRQEIEEAACRLRGE